MKILKIFGIVVGIHVFALILIFANPGCSSTAKTPPSPSDTAAPPATTTPTVNAPASTPPASIYSSTTDSSTSTPPITFNPDAPAIAAPSSGGGTRATPTRPGTPVANVLAADPVSDVTPVTTYTVKSGDNLWTIARRNNLTTAQLASANNLPPNPTLQPGQKLLIPARPTPTITPPPANGGSNANKGASAPASKASTRSGAEMKHVVKSGETLGGIARRYGVRQSDIGSVNNIADPAKIHPGMELIIPGWKGTNGKQASKSAKKSSTEPATPPPVTTPAPEPIPVPAETPTEPTTTTQPTVPVIKIDEPAPEPKQP